MASLIRTISLIAFTLIACACSPIKVKTINTYTISNYQEKIPSSHARTRLNLLITDPIASAGFQTDEMIYVKTPYQLQHFATHKWVAPPAQMILPILTQALRNKHYFHAVVEAPFSGSANYRLDTKLLLLQQNFIPSQSLIQVVIQASLLNSDTNKVVASRVFKVVIPASANTPYGGVLATTRAVNRVAKQIATFVVKAKQSFT